MTKVSDLTTGQLYRILAIKEQIEALQSQLDSITAGVGGLPIPSTEEFPKKRRKAAAGRAAMAAGARAGWGHIQGANETSKTAEKGKQRLSAGGKAPMIASSKARSAKVKADKTIPEPSEPAKKKDRGNSPAGSSGRDAEIRETGRGLVEHLDEMGSQQGHAQLIEYLKSLRIHYTDDSGGQGGGNGSRASIRGPFNSDTMPDWLKLAQEQFPVLGETIYSFADRHRDKVLRRHERAANINGLSNFINVMVATSKVLFVYLRRGVLTQPQVIARMRDYLNIFTGTLPEYRDEEATGYLARTYSNSNGNQGPVKKTFEEHNVAGHLRALLLVAQVVRGSAEGSDASKAGSQLPMLVDQIKAFEDRIGLARATAVQIGRALEEYEMLTEQELALWTKEEDPSVLTIDTKWAKSVKSEDTCTNAI